jgi:DNA-binding response OmpR family regulator
MHTVLCIDDHPATLVTLQLLIRADGYICMTAATLQESEAVCSAFKMDVIILDHGLPGINGSELACRLKSLRPVPVVMLSGNPELEGKPDSVDLLLAKPQYPPDLLAAVKGIIRDAAGQ